MDWFTAWCWMVACGLILCGMFIQYAFKPYREGDEEIKAPAGCAPSVRILCFVVGLVLAMLAAARMWFRA